MLKSFIFFAYSKTEKITKIVPGKVVTIRGNYSRVARTIRWLRGEVDSDQRRGRRVLAFSPINIAYLAILRGP